MAGGGAAETTGGRDRKKRLLITGGAGLIGTILCGALADEWEVSPLDRIGGSGCLKADITNLEEISPFFEGMDAVIHLAGDSHMEATWDSVYSNNILGTYNVFEAARRAGVKRLIFASSNHVTGLYEADWPVSAIVKGELEAIVPSQIPMITHLTPPRPDSLYGVSKLYGEGLGAFYSRAHQVSTICLRIGTVGRAEWPEGSQVRYFATWLTHRDLVQLVRKSLAVSDLSFDIFYGVSRNKWRFWDIQHPHDVLGYEPLDDAEIARPERSL
jgi:nucleoside-diphosphate-sugar epimerase